MHFIKLTHSLKQVLYSFAAIISFFLYLSVILPISKAHIKFYTKSTTEENLPSDDINKIYLNASWKQIGEIIFEALILIFILIFLICALTITLLACEVCCPDCVTPIIEFIDGLGIRHRLRNHFRRLFRVRREPRRPPDLDVHFYAMRHVSDEEKVEYY
ncbi:uncharacterized protein LOC114944432 [Nylanderia fulva]|uniref:uncharacterized protein LOC114944432 n=1 Tax=Nylanderia fulva TaxID=613905 RepID=UPI0010FBAF92|nr:uncharacterized protein LOC114944432 [Nylanderia fulva]